MNSIATIEHGINVHGDSAPQNIIKTNVSSIFSYVDNSYDISFPCYLPDNQYIPIAKQNHILSNTFLRQVLSFLEDNHNDALYLYGPSGCGKTSGITQIASKLKWPTIHITLNGRFELSNLIGYNTIINEKVSFIYGPLARAMKYGYILVLNEIDLADASELAGLNDILEGRDLVIPQNNGEIIKAHKYFRLIVTANTKGDGNSGEYVGAQLLNAAFLDRFRFIECNYLDNDQEYEIIKKNVPQLSKNLIKSLIKIANEIRLSNQNTQFDHITISIPMSNRALQRWCRLIVNYHGIVDDPINTALKEAFGARLSKEEEKYVQRLVKDTISKKTFILENKK